jgi:hypothetical protein
MEVNMKLTGARELEELMVKGLPPAFGRRALIAGMKKAAEPMVTYAKARVPSPTSKSSGALRHSIGIQTLRYETGATTPEGEPAVAWLKIGPKSGQGKLALQAWMIYKSYYSKGKISLKKGAPIGQIRHGHLVEWGFTMRDGRKYPGRPFLKPAAQVGAPIAFKIVVAETRKKVLASIKRHNAKMRKK